jgi:hypothetical protein
LGPLLDPDESALMTMTMKRKRRRRTKRMRKRLRISFRESLQLSLEQSLGHLQLHGCGHCVPYHVHPFSSAWPALDMSNFGTSMLASPAPSAPPAPPAPLFEADVEERVLRMLGVV